jgi:hypothetical protein
VHVVHGSGCLGCFLKFEKKLAFFLMGRSITLLGVGRDYYVVSNSWVCGGEIVYTY